MDDAAELSEAEIARRFEATVRRMAKTPPEPKPDKRASSKRIAEDEAITTLRGLIVTYFNETAVPSCDSYVRSVLGGLLNRCIKADLRVVAYGAPDPLIVASIDPLADRLVAYATEQWNLRNRHVASPTVSEAPKASS